MLVDNDASFGLWLPLRRLESRLAGSRNDHLLI